MNNKFLRFFAFGLAMLIGLMSSHWVLALVMFGLVDAAIGLPQARLCVNTVGTLATATIIQEALALVFTKRPILNEISTGFTDRNGSPVAAYGQAVITRTKGLPTVQNAGSAASATGDVDVSVTLNNFKEVKYQFTAIEYSSTNRDLIRERAEPMATAIANYIVDQISALWTIANFPTRTGADAVANGSTITKTFKAAGWDYTHLVDVRGTLNKSGVPDSIGRFYVGNSDVYGSMLTDLRIVGWLNNQDNQSAIKLGRLPEVAGFRLAEYPALPTTGNMVGFSGSPDSTVYAHRVPRDPREVIPGLPVPGNLGIVTEPRTGLSVMAVEYLDMATLDIITKLLWMNGVAVGNKNNGQLIVTS
jgi:hypothetical protein